MAGQRLTPPGQPTEDDLIQPPQRVVFKDEPVEDTEERQKIATPEQEVAAEGELLTELSNEERGWFETLLTVGRRTKSINVMGHTVVIQNLNTDDDLRIGLFCRDYQGAPPADSRSYQLATCAAGIRSVDGMPLYQPLGETDDQELFDQKLTKLRKYYPVVITQIYREILALDGEFMELAEKLGKLKG